MQKYGAWTRLNARMKSYDRKMEEDIELAWKCHVGEVDEENI